MESWKEELKAGPGGAKTPRRLSPYELLKNELVAIKLKNRELKSLLNAAKTNLDTKVKGLAAMANDNSGRFRTGRSILGRKVALRSSSSCSSCSSRGSRVSTVWTVSRVSRGFQTVSRQFPDWFPGQFPD